MPDRIAAWRHSGRMEVGTDDVVGVIATLELLVGDDPPMPPVLDQLPITVLAARSGVSTSALRLREARGLIVVDSPGSYLLSDRGGEVAP